MNFVKICKALADEHRFKILKTIIERKEINCGEVTELFHLSQPTISYHLKILYEAGLITVRREGQMSIYSPNVANLVQFYNLIGQELMTPIETTNSATS